MRDGESQAENALGVPIFEYLQQSPEQAAEFTSAMENMTTAW